MALVKSNDSAGKVGLVPEQPEKHGKHERKIHDCQHTTPYPSGSA